MMDFFVWILKEVYISSTFWARSCAVCVPGNGEQQRLKLQRFHSESMKWLVREMYESPPPVGKKQHFNNKRINEVRLRKCAVLREKKK
jgi:hypothetical protein